MAYKYLGDATLGVSLNVNTPKPLDIRAVVNSTLDLYSIPESTAYIGMTVANVADGNIYMLIDKSKIGEKSGWKASYESIQIITCTAEEYKTWLDNTNIDGERFSPKDETIPFIHSNTYYYIYENTGFVGTDADGNSVLLDNLYYITKKWIEEALATKANVGIVEDLEHKINKVSSDTQNSFSQINEKLSTEYTTTILLEADFYKKDYIDSNIYVKTDLYTKDEIDQLFVTKESLRGDSLEGEDDFVFVTLSKYKEDQTLLLEQLENKINSESDASLNSLTTDSIKSETILNIEAADLTFNNEKILVESDVNKHITLTLDEFDNLPNKDSNTYYYVYDDNIKDGWVLKSTLNAYYLKEEVDLIISNLQNLINELTSRIESLEV